MYQNKYGTKYVLDKIKSLSETTTKPGGNGYVILYHSTLVFVFLQLKLHTLGQEGRRQETGALKMAMLHLKTSCNCIIPIYFMEKKRR